jgi:hypothetical protein
MSITRGEKKERRGMRPLQANFASTICNDDVASFQQASGTIQTSIKHTASNILPPLSNF